MPHFSLVSLVTRGPPHFLNKNEALTGKYKGYFGKVQRSCTTRCTTSAALLGSLPPPVADMRVADRRLWVFFSSQHVPRISTLNSCRYRNARGSAKGKTSFPPFGRGGWRRKDVAQSHVTWLTVIVVHVHLATCETHPFSLCRVRNSAAAN